MVVIIAIVGAVFSTGRTFGRVHQSLMSHQQVTVRLRYKPLGLGIGGWESTGSKGTQRASSTYLRAKDLEQMSHEKGFSLVSVVRR